MSRRQVQKMLAELEHARNGVYRRVTALLSRGNMALQAGRYATEKDIARMRDKVAGYEFALFRTPAR